MGERIATYATEASALGASRNGMALYRESRGRMASSSATWPPLELPYTPIFAGLPFHAAAFVLSQRTAKLASCTHAGYGDSGASVRSTATTSTPLSAIARSIGSSALRSFAFHAPP